MTVSAIIVTRGDVDLKPILKSLPEEWDVLVWDNGAGSVSCRVMTSTLARIVTGKGELPDLAVYGRYAAIEYASGELIYVQDDDCVLPAESIAALVERWSLESLGEHFMDAPYTKHLVANMPEPFLHDFYADHCLVGFGAVFHRDAPQRAFERFNLAAGLTAGFDRTCDVIFTGLTPRVLVDVPYENLPWATNESRMYRQPKHVEERMRMLELVRKVRDS